MASVVSFAQHPDEVPEFIAYLETTGDIWARAGSDDPLSPKYTPGPIASFLENFGIALSSHHSIPLLIGTREDVLNPALFSHETIEGGDRIPLVQFGNAIPNAWEIIGGTKSQRIIIDHTGSPLISYHVGRFLNEKELSQSGLCFYPGHFIGNEWVPHPPEFMKWGKNVLAWMRRRTPEKVQIHRCNYSIRATARITEACKNGLVVI